MYNKITNEERAENKTGGQASVQQDNTGPLNSVYTQRSQRDSELDLQPSRGPRQQDSMGEMMRTWRMFYKLHS